MPEVAGGSSSSTNKGVSNTDSSNYPTNQHDEAQPISITTREFAEYNFVVIRQDGRRWSKKFSRVDLFPDNEKNGNPNDDVTGPKSPNQNHENAAPEPSLGSLVLNSTYGKKNRPLFLEKEVINPARRKFNEDIRAETDGYFHKSFAEDLKHSDGGKNEEKNSENTNSNTIAETENLADGDEKLSVLLKGPEKHSRVLGPLGSVTKCLRQIRLKRISTDSIPMPGDTMNIADAIHTHEPDDEDLFLDNDEDDHYYTKNSLAKVTLKELAEKPKYLFAVPNDDSVCHVFILFVEMGLSQEEILKRSNLFTLGAVQKPVGSSDNDTTTSPRIRSSIVSAKKTQDENVRRARGSLLQEGVDTVVFI